MTGNPVLLYSVAVEGNTVTCVSVDNLIPSTSGLGYWNPSISVFSLTGNHADKILIHEKKVFLLESVIFISS